jgi:cell pole-organizing protein PopZ
MAAAPAPTGREEALLSEAVASATAAALTRLAGSMRVADDPNQTIEGLVRELLKPMLKDWLDTHLHAIVEAKVEAALERVARLAR